MEKKIKDIQFKKKFKFSKEQDEYIFQLRKKRNYWWLLLFLLPLLLFIRCDHDITVQTIDEATETPIIGVPVTMSYRPHLLFENGHFLPRKDVIMMQSTDSTGTTTFKGIECDVFSYIFYCLSKASFSIYNECYEIDPDPDTELYHFTRNVKLNMKAKREDVKLIVKDKETEYPLADAKIEYRYTEGGSQRTDTIKSNANGEAVIKNFMSCGSFSLIKVSCYGYVDTLATNRSVSTIREYADSATFLLRPIKQSFTYYVKNKESGQPIPGARCVVTLTDGKANINRGTSTTNVDGIGKGVYDNAFILAKLDIEASKPRYKNGKLDGNYNVEQFAALPDSMRVIYLEPEPYVQEFQNRDSITDEPIAGVTNEITVTDFDGKQEGPYTEISNRNGIFPVKAKEGYKIDIISKLEPDYITKETHIAKFDSVEIIRMMPDTVSMTFRTIDDETGELVPNCDLQITTSRSGVSIPVNSGTGEFVVAGLYRGESISIISSKKDYYTNDTKIKNLVVNYLLNAQQRARDIPMIINLPPCNVSLMKHNTGQAGTQIMTFNLNKRSGTLRFRYKTYSIPDEIKIYNCPEADIANNTPIWETHGPKTVENDTIDSVPFSGPVITVVGISTENGSAWEFEPECP